MIPKPVVSLLEMPPRLLGGLLVVLLFLALAMAFGRPVTLQATSNAQTESIILPAAGVPQTKPFTFIAWGDMPYRKQDEQPVAAMIQEINAAQPAFVVNVGDTKNGSSLCNGAAYKEVLHRFELFKAPLVYTPGDNEWTDCARKLCGGYNPLGRLKLIRQLFFLQQNVQPDKPSRLEKSLPVQHQCQNAKCTDGDTVENSRWIHEGIVFVSVHVVGSNNALPQNGFRSRQAEAESAYRQRQNNNRQWIAEAFQMARTRNALGVVVFFHGDPRFDAVSSTRTGFEVFTNQLEWEAKRFGKPVLLVHGDSHRYKIDHPMRDSRNGAVMFDVTRVVVPGDDWINAVKIAVDPTFPSLFHTGLLLKDKSAGS